MLSQRRGFTLIELMIVIIVIAILALIVIPKLAGASKKAKESTLVANLGMIRNALEQFNADCGTYPTNLNDLGVATTTATTIGASTVPANSYKGPYLRPQGGLGANAAVPLNPFVASRATADMEVTGTTYARDDTKHWFYDSASGKVWSSYWGTTTDTNTGYSTL